MKWHALGLVLYGAVGAWLWTIFKSRGYDVLATLVILCFVGGIELPAIALRWLIKRTHGTGNGEMPRRRKSVGRHREPSPVGMTQGLSDMSEPESPRDDTHRLSLRPADESLRPLEPDDPGRLGG